MSYEGRLAYAVETTFTNGAITFWILEDAEKHKWSCKHWFNASLEHYVPSLECIFVLDGINHAGEFIYVPLQSYNTTFSIVYFDPKRNSFREIKFADEEFRVRNGIGDTFWGTFYSSPDHRRVLCFCNSYKVIFVSFTLLMQYCIFLPFELESVGFLIILSFLHSTCIVQVLIV